MTPQYPCLKRRSRAFTLVELLCAVAIIGILFSLLMVAVDRVRASANSAKCVSHWRQWDAALKSYISDNNGYMPETSFLGKEVWLQLSPHLSFDGVADMRGQKLSNMQNYIRHDTSCPVEDWGYGFNVYLTGKTQKSNGENVAVAKPYSLIEMPSQTIFGIDMMWPKRWLDGTVIKGGSSEEYLAAAPEMPHNGKVSVLYLDGHVESKYVYDIMMAELTRSSPSYKSSHLKKSIAEE